MLRPLLRFRTLTLRKGDHLAITLPQDTPLAAAKELIDGVRERWPHIDVLLFVGDVELTRIRKKETTRA